MNTKTLNQVSLSGDSIIKKGGGGSGGSGGGLTYFDVTPLSEKYEENELWNMLGIVLNYAYIVRGYDSNKNIVFNTRGFLEDYKYFAMGIDLNAKISRWDDDVQKYNGMETIESCIKRFEPWILELPRLTEEEFYKIPTTQFRFYNGERSIYYYYDEGMTWEEWIDSPYNDGNFSVRDADFNEGLLPYVDYGGKIVRMYGDYVKPHMLIQNEFSYAIPSVGE